MLKGVLRAAAGLLAFVGFGVHADSCIWYADDDTLRQVRVDTNQVTRVIPLVRPHRLAMNAADCGVWTVNRLDRRLRRFNAEGALEQEIRVRSLDPPLAEIERLALDSYDGSVWVSDERQLRHISASGQLLGSFSAPGQIRRMRVALDQTLWVLGRRDLWRFNDQGTLLSSHHLGRHLARDARHFAIDSLGEVLWLADEYELAQVKLVNPTEPPLRIPHSQPITGMALDPLTGNIWIEQSLALRAYSREGAPTYTLDLNALGIHNPEKLAFDPASRSLWMGAESSVIRFTDTGQLVVRLPAGDSGEALGVPAFKVEPTLTLVRPPENALANNAQPLFTLGYGAQCNGQPCPFENDYFGGYQPSATLNDQAVGEQFALDPNAAQANFTPAARLPEGANTFSAQVKDGLGHSSNTVTNSFTIDTLAPLFLTITPPDGSVFAAPNLMIQGSVDDPSAVVVLSGSGMNQSGGSFGFPVILQPGLNTFSLSAIDPAGNAANATLRLTFTNVTLSVASPANGATVDGDRVTVSGNLQGPFNSGVTVNGQVATLVGGQFFATVPLIPGPNTITVTATAPNGGSSSTNIQVTSTGPGATNVSASQTTGFGPLTVAFTVTSDRPIQRVEGNFAPGLQVCNRFGCVEAGVFNVSPLTGPLSFTYTQPGAYEARFDVIHTDSTTVTKTVRIVIQDLEQLDQHLKQVWSGFVQTLTARDKAAAMNVLTQSAQARYAPVFDALLPALPAVAASVSAPQRTQITETLGEYAVTRPGADGTLRLFLIYFLRSSDGVWLLDSM